MNKMLKLIILLVLGFLCFNGVAQTEIKQTEADRFWQNRPKPTLSHQVFLYGDSDKDKQGEIGSTISIELFSQLHREWGIAFWSRFPNDPRRFEWFRESKFSFSPYYFKNLALDAKSMTERKPILVDTIAQQRWEKYYMRFLNELLSSSSVADMDKSDAILFDLNKQLEDGIGKLKSGIEFDLKNWTKQAIDYGRKYKPNYLMQPNERYFELLSTLGKFFTPQNDFNVKEEDLMIVLKSFENSDIPAYEKFASEKSAIMALQKQPLALKSKTWKGTDFDLKDYKGKLVLVDFWSLACTSCIEKMPEIKEVYEKYKAKGFEVISACFLMGKRADGSEVYKDEKKQILKVHEKIGADWPLLLLGNYPGELGDHIKKTYGFYSVPRLLLLDEKGKLLHYQGSLIKKGGVERIVKKYIDNKSK